MIEVARAINHFASEQQHADFVQQSDQLITLTYGLLSEIIRGAVHQALTETRQDDEERQISAERDIQLLRDEIEVLKHELSKVAGQASDALDDVQTAFDTMNKQSRAINQLAQKTQLTPPPKPTATTAGKLEKLDDLLLARSEPVSFSEIGKSLELGSRDPRTGRSTRRQNMTLLGKVISSHQERYIIHKASRGNQRFVTLNPEYRAHLRRMAAKV
ncbi:MAG: hypothetical protein A4E48_00069 [Methanosaeta sp. PtaU1.Bin060]|nr:MAG: hypothetical protein A4E48_00069 [Methanosaeta sp. PtaU1.Bin060]